MSDASIIVNETKGRFGIVPDGLLFDTRLSLQARTVAITLCSRSKNFVTHIWWVCRELGINDKRWRSIRAELAALGMLHSERKKGTNGKFVWKHTFVWKPACEEANQDGFMMDRRHQDQDDASEFIDTATPDLFESMTSPDLGGQAMRLFGTDAEPAQQPVQSYTNQQQQQHRPADAVSVDVVDKKSSSARQEPQPLAASTPIAETPAREHWVMKRQRAIELCPTGVDVETWTAYVDMRRTKSKPLTAHTAGLIADRLKAFAADGHDATAILNTALLKGWMDVYAPSKPAFTAPESVTFDAEEVSEGLRSVYREYPMSRRGDLRAIAAMWDSMSLESHAAEIVTAIQASKCTTKWTKEEGRYVPGLLKFLSENRWQEPVAGSWIAYEYRDEDKSSQQSKSVFVDAADLF